MSFNNAKYFASKFTTGIEAAVKAGLKPEEVFVFADTNFSSLESMREYCDPRKYSVFNEREFEFAVKLWETGNILETKEVLEGTKGIKNYTLSHNGRTLTTNPYDLIQEPSDVAIFTELQDKGLIPFTTDEKGSKISVDKYLEAHRDEFMFKMNTPGETFGIKKCYAIESFDKSKIITIPDEITNIGSDNYFSRCRVIVLGPNVENAQMSRLGPENVVVYNDENQREMLLGNYCMGTILSRDEFREYIAAGGPELSPVDWMRVKDSNPLIMDGDTVVGIKRHWQDGVQNLELPEGINKIDFDSIRPYVKTIASFGEEPMPINDWFRMQDPQPLIIEDGVVMGIKTYHYSVHETITIPAEAVAINSDALSDEKIKTVIIENPDIRLQGRNAPFYRYDGVEVYCAGEQMNSADWLRKHCPDQFFISDERIELKPWWNKSSVVKVNDGVERLPPIIYTGDATELHIPSSFKDFNSFTRINDYETSYIGKIDTLVFDKDMSVSDIKLDFDPFSSSFISNKINLIVASEEVSDKIRSVLKSSSESRITFMTHEQFAEYQLSNENRIDGGKSHPADWMVIQEVLAEMEAVDAAQNYSSAVVPHMSEAISEDEKDEGYGFE